ncbi:MAG: MATE family efflux transporter [Clostridia bacterium]|nr:MATE family efflux transporter [Clostridia bacterium]
MIKLSDHFTYKRIIRFTLPSIIMLIFTSVYGIVDGFFVSNFVGKEEFTAVNFIMPFLMILGGVGFMFGTGGSALIAKTLGEGNEKKANSVFSLIVYISIITGVLLTLLGNLLILPFTKFLGATGVLLENCILYGRIILAGVPFCILQFEFQALFITAEKPKLGLYSSIAAGVTNIVLDALFIAVFDMGLIGAATATVLSQVVGGIFPLVYFGRKNSSLLKLGRTGFDGASILKTVTNGSSELMTNISMSVVSMIYNVQLLAYAGEDGVAAYGVLMYVSLIFNGIFIGYSVGSAPVISYNFGAKNSAEFKSLLKKSFVIIGICSVAMLFACQLLARPLSLLFVGYDQSLLSLTERAFFFYSFVFLFAGIAIFGSSFFTALNNGLISAVISFLRTLVFQIGAVLLFPLIWQIDGIWLSLVAAEIMAVAVTLIFLAANKKKYDY